MKLTELLGRGGMAEVWAAKHLTLGVEVAVKFLRLSGVPDLRERFAREAQLAARIDHPHAVRVFDHGITADGVPFIVMERIVGEVLSDRIRRVGGFATEDARAIIDQVAAVLSHAHAQDIIHRDIKPHNIMVLEGRELSVKVLDFGLAKLLYETDAESPAVTQAGWIVGTPAYMSPERLIEAETATPTADAWSLAVLAYELLTGRRPFTGPLQAAIAMAMITRRFQSVNELRPDLPKAIGRFFKKALAPQAKDRFANIEALRSSFSEALDRAEGAVCAEGPLVLSERVYGRDEELTQLQQVFDKAQARSGLLFVSGYSGVGKTALVEEGRRRMARRGITFAYGKFDQFNRGTPYHSLVQALRDLTRAVVPKDEASRKKWRETLSEAVGDNAPLLIELVPELEEHFDISEVDLLDTWPPEARNRIAQAVERLLHALASEEHPLIVFLDDLQWADLPTFELLTRLATEGDPAARHVLLVGSYRSNEVDPSHPLSFVCTKLREDAANFSEIRLGPLGEDAVLEMLTDALGPGAGRVRLAIHCHQKTQGNPFFLRRFLETLLEEGLLLFEEESRAWTWDETAVLARRVDGDVVDFIATELRRLPEATIECLALAACIGNRFELEPLAFLLSSNRRETLDRLRPAIWAHLVVPGNEELVHGHELGSQSVSFRFAHDRVQQASRSLLDDTSAGDAHHKIATFLLEHLDDTTKQSRVFELVEHMNRGATLHPEAESDSGRLQAMNLDAARRATRAAAFEPAALYYRRALELFDASTWQSDYEAALALHVEGARSAYLGGRPEEMDRLIAIVVEHAKTPVDRVQAREVAIQAHIAAQRFSEAVSLAIELLADLGSPVPAELNAETIGGAVGGAIELLKERDLESVVQLPGAVDPRVLLTQRIRQNVMSAAYLTEPQLFPILPTEILHSTLSDGVVDQSAYGFAVFGIVLNASGLIDTAYATGQMALGLLDRNGARSAVAKVRHIVTGHLAPFVEPIRDCVGPGREIYQAGKESGDLEYACWALHLMVANGLYSGMRLGPLREMDARHVDLIRQHRQLPALGCALPISQTIQNCVGSAGTHSSRLVGDNYNEDDHMAELESMGFRGAAYILTTVRTFVRFLFRQLDSAVEAAESGAAYADGAVATYHQVWWRQFRALALLGSKGEAAIDDAREALEALRHWCSFSEANHAHRVALLAAEIARVEGKDSDAMASYDAAVEHAQRHRFLHEEALANELAARFYLERGSQTAARGYLLEARDAYVDWGADAKVQQLDAELGHVMSRRRGR